MIGRTVAELRVLMVLGVMAACIGDGRRVAQPSARARASAGRPSPDVEALLAQMTIDEKIGQMTQADLKALKRESDVGRFFLGSVLSGGDSLPKPNEAGAWADAYDRLQSAALETRLGIPILFGIDAVHGHNGLKGAVIVPHNIGLGCTRNPDLVEKLARLTAIEVAATGMDWAFAPCLAVPRDERWGRTYEGFGEKPELAESLGAASVRGLQTARLDEPTAVLACAKHFVGDGGTAGGKDQGDTKVTEEELRALHLPGYRAAIAAGVGSVMVSHSSWNGTPMHAHKRLITEVLKGELGFKGFVVTDWQAIDRLPGDYRSDVLTAIDAGIDMVMVPNRYPEFTRTLKALVEDGKIPMSRIDDAVRRILGQKVAMKLWERPFADRALLPKVGSPEHRALARQAVRESLVLLKNDKRTLPLAKAKRVLVAGSRADDIGAQCGGWCVSWQGKRGPITPGTTVLAGLREVARAAQVTFSPEGTGAESADVVIAVVGENPYAEDRGDRSDLALAEDERALLERLDKTGKPLVVVLLSGRPMILGAALEQAEAFVAAWLPGTEGGGIADVLYGVAKPTGKLSHTWPRSMEQIPINDGDGKADPLFRYGAGLTYP